MKQTLDDYQKALRSLFDENQPVLRRMTFIIDGLDQLDDFDADAVNDWLPDQLPINVKVIISMRSGDQVDRLRAKWPDSAFFQVQYDLTVKGRHVDFCLWLRYF